MKPFRKRIFLAAGYNTLYFGPGRKEFDPKKPMPTFETYLQESAQGTLQQLHAVNVDEGVLGSFMSARFLNQANLPGFLPFMVPQLKFKPCTGVEGACGTGGRSVAVAARSVLADLADVVFVGAFEMQNTMKPIYGADVLAGAAYYSKERKTGHAYFFPGIFAERAKVYYERYGYDFARQGMARWYEQMILNARKNPKAQEFQNSIADLYEAGMTEPDPTRFLPYLNHFDCSKISDGASSLLVLSEEGIKRVGVKPEQTVEIIALGEAEGDITQLPEDATIFTTTQQATAKAYAQSGLTREEISVLEVHDCFTISGLLALEAAGFAQTGKAPEFIMNKGINPSGPLAVNLSGGLLGFGHPTGASGVRQLVDLLHQFTGKAAHPINTRTPYGMAISMGGNDKTVTCTVVKKWT